MKTLAQSSAHAGLMRATPGDFSNQYVISQPGRIIHDKHRSLLAARAES